MTAEDTIRLARGFATRALWEVCFMRRDVTGRVFVGRVFRPRWPLPFERWCAACGWKGTGLPGDGCPRCGAAADDGVPAE